MGPRRKNSPQLTRLELQIMEVLWDVGPSTVLGVQNAMPGDGLAYTTIQTMLNILHRKGRVKRKLSGKAFTYTPVVSREHAVREAVGDMVDRLFGGSTEALVMSLLKTKQFESKKLAKLTELVEKRQKEEERGRN
jgi:BlaI family transcriptional regulator, penicillinase repressor